MKIKITYLIILYIIFYIFSCNKSIIIPATQDSQLSSYYPEINFDGKKQALINKGYGTIKKIKNNYTTYPSLYIYTGDNDLLDSFIIGGFDISNLKTEVKHASLKFFINYCSNNRKNICLFIRPVRNDWKESKIKFSDVYINNEGYYNLSSLIESDDNNCILVVFNIKQIEYKDQFQIPNKNSKRFISINVTQIVNNWINSKYENHGFLIEPVQMNDFRYKTTDLYNKITNTGIIEIASSEWFLWNGNIPDNFYLKNGKWINLKNKAKNKIKYIPRLVITL